jgi:lipopolysaccharide transport system ATP-binding protein
MKSGVVMKKSNSEELRLVPSQPPPQTASTQNWLQSSMASLEDCGVVVKGAVLEYPIGPHVRGSIKANLLRLFGHRDRIKTPDYVVAIKGLDLAISFGERVGIIGHNGSGKSTFLRMLGGIYPVKSGDIRVTGRIGALLDIGQGFEPESTGRENIYYRGMALGYSRAELKAAEAQIIEFADLGEFIDLPMRTYSSGMYVRLGFAISTQFAPDVLLIDEVFGAGDAAFAARALQRMLGIVEKAGVMVLASHDIGLIERVCSRVLWFHKGEVVRDGPPAMVTSQYRRFMAGEPVLHGPNSTKVQ